MKKLLVLIGLLVLSLALTGCGPAPAAGENAQPEEAGQDVSTQVTGTAPAGTATEAVASTATEEPTATEGVPLELVRVGDLVPFAPAWFDTTQTLLLPAPGSNGRLVRNGGLESIVVAESDHLYIYAPLSPFDPPPVRSLFGGITADTYLNFDLTASFNLEGGYCYPEGEVPQNQSDDYCGHLGTNTCIVFGFLDSDNFQHFCLLPSSSQIGNAPVFQGYWFRSGFDDGVFFSYTTTDTGLNLQGSDAIRDMGLLSYRGFLEVPAPNEMRLRMQDGVLSGYVNGQQLFEQDIKAGTTVTVADGGQIVVFEQLVAGKIGVGCTSGFNPNRIVFSNCDVTMLFGTP